MSQDEFPPRPLLEPNPPLQRGRLVEAAINPYAPTAETVERPVSESELAAERVDSPATLQRTAIRWLVVCGISALPSFYYGLLMTNGQIAGMVLGILIFAAGYTWLDYQTASRPFRRKKTIRRTLRIAYGTRIAISILFPVGMYLDLMCGLVSVSLVQAVAGEQLFGSGEEATSFGVSLVTTLVQGCVLNVVLGVYGLIILVLQLVVTAVRR